MPRKTRKQKMQANLRKVYSITGIISQPIKVENNPPVDNISRKFVIKDLRKTLALSTLATVIELVLYWRLR